MIINGYVTKKIQDCCFVVTDGDHLPPPKAEKGVPFITISNIDDNNQLNFDNVMFVPESYYDNLPTNKRAKRGDILYSVVGSFGKPVYIHNDDKFVFQRHIALLKPNKYINGKYLYYTLLNSHFFKRVEKIAIGCAQKTITLDTLRNIDFTVPPIFIQNKIVNLLEPIDKAICTLCKINDNLVA